MNQLGNSNSDTSLLYSNITRRVQRNVDEIPDQRRYKMIEKIFVIVYLIFSLSTNNRLHWINILI